MTTITNAGLARAVEHGVGTLILNHPPANTLTPDLLAEMESAFETMARDNTVKAIVFTGAGRFFIAGADIRVIAGIPSSREGAELALRGQALFNKIEGLDKPVIAAINGMCLGGGLELAMCCHIRLAADGARFGQPEINLGIMPGFGGTQRLSRIIGRSRATEMLLTGDSISAQEAKALGLISQVVPPDDLLRQAQGLARKIASKGQAAVRSIQRAVHQGAELDLREALELEARLFGGLCDTQDKKEGVAAFLEKRQPRFQDR
ncbi:MAG: enoyl-CoA hydratase-related protein [Nitrospiraceae bacterium]